MVNLWQLLPVTRNRIIKMLFALNVVLAYSSFLIFTHFLEQEPGRWAFPVIGRNNYMKPIAELHKNANKSGRFLVDNAKCRIPDIPLRGYENWEEGFPREDVCSLVPNITYVDFQDVVINATLLETLGYNLSSVTCCYRTILRATECGNMTRPDLSDYRFCDSLFCHPMSRVTRPTSMFIRVICRSSQTHHSSGTNNSSRLFYQNFHIVGVLPTLKNKLLQQKLNYWKHQPKSDKSRPFNILILGLDATSRLNAYRNLPTSLPLLRNLGAVEMRGYNKVGSNTLPCLVPLLSGHSLHELQRMCLNGTAAVTAPIQILSPASVVGPFDKCPWIWKEFSQHNYVTAYFEDQPSISIFTYLKKGFMFRPADIYSRPWMMAAYRYFDKHFPEHGHCLGYETGKQAILRQIRYLAHQSQEGEGWPFFTFAWMTHRLHEDKWALSGLDLTLAKTLNELNESGILENTLLVVMGDHGYRYIVEWTGHNWFETRLPLLFIRLPERLVRQYPEVATALQYNARQLLTTFDLHATLENVLALATQKKVTSETHQIPKRGLSLFRPLPQRTCEEAGVPTEFCTCEPLTVTHTMTKDVALAARFIVAYINAGLPKICHSLSLNHTLGYAEMGLPSPGTKKYLVALKLKPGEMEFEAVVTLNKTWKGQVPDQVKDLRRLDSYNQTHIQCLNQNATLKLMYEPFCYCRNFTYEFRENVLMNVF